MGKLKEILLIDDSKGTNSLNKRLLREMDVAQHISTELNGRLALDYLLSKNEKGNYPSPDIIFLDINMPVIDGWEFLNRYEGIVPQDLRHPVIIILSTSVNPSDHDRAESHPSVTAYCSKPLSADKLRDIVDQYFS